MSDHLVEIPNEGWGSWEESVSRSRVRFTCEHLELGEMLVSRTQFPDENRILQVQDYYDAMSVTRLYQVTDFNVREPVHPLLMLALASGIEGASDSSIFDHMQYPMAMSPFLLADYKGNNYIFLLKNDREHFFGEFRSLTQNDQLPRCTHVWGYTPGKEPDHKAPFHTFRLRADGKYGPFVAG